MVREFPTGAINTLYVRFSDSLARMDSTSLLFKRRPILSRATKGKRCESQRDNARASRSSIASTCCSNYIDRGRDVFRVSVEIYFAVSCDHYECAELYHR